MENLTNFCGSTSNCFVFVFGIFAVVFGSFLVIESTSSFSILDAYERSFKKYWSRQ